MESAWVIMDICIKTLTGAIYDLRVSPFESILSIKSKLENLEGIPVSQQHLIWQSSELRNDICLHDVGIISGAHLTLVLAMKDGPVNMRKVSVENVASMDGLELLMDDDNKDGLMEHLMVTEDKNQLTFLVFCEGDQVNFFRIFEEKDSDMLNSDDVPGHSTDSAKSDDKNGIEQQRENFITKDKMNGIRQQIEAKCKRKGKKNINVSRPPSTALITLSRDIPSQCSTILQSRTSKTDGNSNLFFDTPPSPLNEVVLLPSPHGDGEEREMGKSRTSLTVKKEINSIHQLKDSCEKEESIRKSNTSKNILLKNSNVRKKTCTSMRTVKDDKNDKNMQTTKSHPNRENPTKKISREEVVLPEISRTCSGKTKENSKINLPEESPDSLHFPTIHENLSDVDNPKNMLKLVKKKRERPHSLSTLGKVGDPLIFSQQRSFTRMHCTTSSTNKSTTCLPPIHQEKNNFPNITTKKKPRCSSCPQKLGLSTTYQCRCEGMFCAKHRYPETHACSFDFKTEGRKILA